MDDIDRVFARFKDDKPEPTNRRETLSIPRRNGAGGSRTVEVVHLRSSAAINDRPRRVDTHVRAASWEAGFPAKRAIATPAVGEPTTASATAPPVHVMPAWEPVAAEETPSPLAGRTPQVEGRRGRGRPRKQISGAPGGLPPFETYQQMLEHLWQTRVLRGEGAETRRRLLEDLALALGEDEDLWSPVARWTGAKR